MTITASPIVVRVGPRDTDVLPLVLTPAEASDLLGVSPDTVRRRILAGRIEVLDRQGEEPWRIPTAKLLDELGIPFKVGAAK